MLVGCSGVADFAELGTRWRDLEQRANGSFFQSWTWVGCCCTERFPDPVLVQATEGSRVVALGLFNRVRRWGTPPTLHLTESGDAALDCPYVEQNGILTEAGREAELMELCLRQLVSRNDVVLSGVGDQVAAAALRVSGLVSTRRSHASPFVDLAAIRRAGGDYLAGRSANTRQQLRRSDRYYEREGPIRVQEAASVEAAHSMLANLAELHQSTWERRGKPGAFAAPFFRRFHRALIEAGSPRNEVSLLEISSANTVIGYLYNFVWRGRLSAYQSGCVYRDAHSHAKPGLTCHHAAICFALDQQIDTYDFLAGEDRYKRSLGDAAHQQYWLDAGPKWSPRQVLRWCGRMGRAQRNVGRLGDTLPVGSMRSNSGLQGGNRTPQSGTHPAGTMPEQGGGPGGVPRVDQ